MSAQQGAPSVLICSLGASWAVVPEVLAWLAPELVDLYANHPQREALRRERDQYGLHRPSEVWILTTDGSSTRNSIGQLRAWWQALSERVDPHLVPRLTVWVADGTSDLAQAEECHRWRELAFRALLAANRNAAETDARVFVSLAGGRKTMSADLQDAATAFGAHALLHVVGDDQKLSQQELSRPTPQRLLIPLTEEAAGAIRPLVVGAATGEEAVRVELMRDRLDRSRFALPPADSEGLARFQADGKALAARVAACRREAQRLLAAHALELTSDEPYEPWPQLLRLDAARIEGLRNGVLKRGAADPLADPSRWPLADLHRHVGGCLDLAAQQEVAAAIIKETPPEHVAAVTQALDLAWPDWAGARGTVGAPPDWPKRLRAVAEIVAPTLAIEVPRARAIASSLVLKRVATETLEGLLWNVTAPRIALKTRHPLGFAAYERPGELSGSALLGHPAAIDVYARAIVRAARAEGLIYLELRGSPHKYRPADPIGFLAEFERALARADAQTRRMTRAEGRRLRVGFIWIIDRRDRSTAPAVIRQVVEARDRLPEFLLGLDLAGDEGTSDPEALARDFDPALRACIPVTIHAGEGEQADRIWQAAYHLHADRIGHGLTLPDHPALARRFRDRGIVLELCPTSNREVVGFCDPARPESAGLPAYPLAAMIHAGLPVTINTDNPAISRTTMADEYLVAARMVGEALLTPWRALALLRLAFRAAFVDAAERRVLEALAASHLLECARGGGAENAAPAPGAGSGDFGSLPP